MSTRTRRRKSRMETDHAHLVFRMRTESEKFPKWMVELMHDARVTAIETLGDVWDWDCHGCQRAVITYAITDNCPHCGGPGAIDQRVELTSEERLLLAIFGLKDGETVAEAVHAMRNGSRPYYPSKEG